MGRFDRLRSEGDGSQDKEDGSHQGEAKARLLDYNEAKSGFLQ